MVGLIKKMFIGLFTGLVNESNHTKCVSLSNPFEVKLDRRVVTLNNLSNKVCVPSKTKDLNQDQVNQ